MLIEEKNMTITHYRRRVVSKGWSAKRVACSGHRRERRRRG